MARPKNADGQRTRQAILDAALELFAEKGYFGTSVRDVARAVGVRESALYNYFAGKEALFEALLAAHHDSKLARLAPLAEGPIDDGRAVLERLALANLEAFLEPNEQKLNRILMSDGLRLARDGRINLHERMAGGRDQLHELLRRLVNEGWLRQADVSVLGLAFFSPLFLWRQLHAIGADLPMLRNPKAFVRQHVDQFLLGAAGPAAGPAAGAAPRAGRARVSSASRTAASARGVS